MSEQVRDYWQATLRDLLAEGRRIWGADYRLDLSGILSRLMVTLGDVARLHRDGVPFAGASATEFDRLHARQNWENDLAKELGNLILSTIRMANDLGFEPAVCVQRAAEAQEKFAASGRPR